MQNSEVRWEDVVVREDIGGGYSEIREIECVRVLRCEGGNEQNDEQ